MTGKARLSQDYAYHNDAIIPAGAFCFLSRMQEPPANSFRGLDAQRGRPRRGFEYPSIQAMIGVQLLIHRA